MKIVAGYIRVSTQEQSTSGLSLETQTEEIKAYCEEKGYKLGKIYADRGVTARKTLYKREAFMEMMQAVEAGEIEHIVVLRLDRFFRNVYDYHRMMNEYLIPHNCGWSAVKEEYDTTTTNGRLMINLRLAIAEQECDQDSDRIKDVVSNKIRAGEAISHPTFGYKVSNKHFVIDEDKAKIVRYIFSDFILTHSVMQTMIDTDAEFGLDFKYYRIRRILKHEVYTGRYRDNPCYCPPIIADKVWDDAQAIIGSTAIVRRSKHDYLFSSLLKCSCGATLCGCVKVRPYKTYMYYRCNHAFVDHSCDCTCHVSEEKVEAYLLEHMDELLKDYVFEVKAKETVRQPKSNRDAITKKINRLTDLFVDGAIAMDEYKRRKADLESQIVDAVSQPKTDLSHLVDLLNSGFRSIYDDLSRSEKQMLWRSIIKEIRLTQKGEVNTVIFL